MKEVFEFFAKLLDTSDWPPRWHCGKWSDFHGWLYIISDLLIWGAYFAIPTIIIRYISYKKHQRFIRLYFLFAAFILACGATHFLDAITFWFPVYRLSALMRAVTAVVSWLTVFYLVKLLPYAFSLKTPELLETEVEMRKKAEAELILKNEQLNEAEIVGSFGHFEWNIKTNEIICSSGMAYLLGVNKNTPVKTYEEFIAFLDPEQRDAEQKIIELSIKARNYEEHLQKIITAGGDKKILLTRGVVIPNANGQIEKIICTSQDVTEIETGKQLLEKSRQTFKNAFDYSPVGVALVGTKGHWLDVNQALCDMLGYSREELLQLTFQDITHPEDLSTDLGFVQQLLARQAETYQMEKRYFKKGGAIVWVLLSVSLVWQDDEPQFFVSQIVDITAKKHLALELEEKNTELQKANNELQSHVTRVNEFNRIIGHNLRGPASSLINMADYLEVTTNEEDTNFLLTKVKSTSQLIINTLNDLKEFIEVQLNDDKKYAVCLFEKVLEQSKMILEPQIKETGAIINAELAVAEVKFPKIYLESIFYNLLSNALKYHSRSQTPVVDISTALKGEYIVLKIKDNGIGINLAKHGNEIFKYRRVFHKGYESNGIGLFLTRNQVDACNGRIEVESEVNKGTTFTIYFQKN